MPFLPNTGPGTEPSLPFLLVWLTAAVPLVFPVCTQLEEEGWQGETCTCQSKECFADQAKITDFLTALLSHILKYIPSFEVNRTETHLAKQTMCLTIL